MNPPDSKKLEEIEKRRAEKMIRDEHVDWLIAKVKEQDREIGQLRKEHAGLVGSECGLMARAAEQDREIERLQKDLADESDWKEIYKQTGLEDKTYWKNCAEKAEARIKELEQELLWAAEACEKAESLLAEKEKGK